MSDLKRILLVDDDEQILDLLSAKLSAHYEIHTVSDPAQAFAAALAARPHLVLCDIDMPEIGGGDVVAALAEDARTRDIPVIYLSGIVSPEELEALDGMISGKPGIAKRSTVKQLRLAIDKALS